MRPAAVTAAILIDRRSNTFRCLPDISITKPLLLQKG
jgi:hypothetical protein